MVEILFRRRSAPYRLRNGLTTYERNGSNKQSISEQEKTTALEHVLADDATERAAIEGKIYEREMSQLKRMSADVSVENCVVQHVVDKILR